MVTNTPFRIVVMGVSGSGKSTVGSLLANEMGLDFIDGDDLHPQGNIDKMTTGIALTDDDRWPWLDSVGRALASAEGDGIVVACSALRRTYRDRIRAAAPDTRFIELSADRDELLHRMQSRPGHFMPPELLTSQLDLLQSLEGDEAGRQFATVNSPQKIVKQAVRWLLRNS